MADTPTNADTPEVVPSVAVETAAPAIDAAPIPQGGDPADTASGEVTPVSSPEAAAAPEPSLLETFDAEKAKPAVEAKPEDAKPEAEKPADGAAVEEPPTDAPAEPAAVEPVDYFEKLTVPDTLKLDDTIKGEVAKAFDTLRTDPAAGAQALLDLHAKTMGEYATHLQNEQMRVWNDTRGEWRKTVMADPILGGAGHQTEMGKVAQARDAFVSRAQPGSPQYQADMAEFNQFMAMTGAGDNPAFLKFLHNAYRYVREAAPPPPDAKPPKDIGKPPGRKGLGSIYNHPTSNPE